jgi:putative transposase
MKHINLSSELSCAADSRYHTCFMPRSTRFIVPGYVYHLTHRCHNRQFLLKFARDRDFYCAKLRKAVRQFKVPLLNYQVTCNHAHLIAYAEDVSRVSRLMKLVAGETAQAYNRRKQRSGAFWEGRFHSTMVEGGQYLWNCLQYVDLNMVRAGKVPHPVKWKWAGYREIMGERQRYRVLDLNRLLWLLRTDDLASFRRCYAESIRQRIERKELARDPVWTESVAVGGAAYVERIKSSIKGPTGVDALPLDDEHSTWVLRRASKL